MRPRIEGFGLAPRSCDVVAGGSACMRPNRYARKPDGKAISLSARRTRTSLLRGGRLGGVAPGRQLPIRADEVAGIAVGVPLQVVLVLGLGFPEGAGGGDLGHDLPRPQAGGVDVV